MAHFLELPLRIALTGLLLSSAVEAAAAQTASAADSRIPPLRLDRPNWKPLTGQQIAALFPGNSLQVDEDYEPFPGVKVKIREFGGCWPSERFFADGGWKRYECQRGPRTFDGRWTTETFRGGERLCVEASDFPRRCRFVWQGKSPHQIFMPFARFRSSDSGDDPDVYNPYRLVKLKPQR